MKKIIYTLLSLCFVLISISANAQETYYLRNKKSNSTLGNKDHLISYSRDVVMDTGYFYDAGGERGPAGNTYYISTIHAKENYLKIYFEKFDIPAGASLKIYEGTDATGQLYGEFKRGDNLFNVMILADAITFEYLPSVNKSEDQSGWKALVFEVPNKNKKLLTTYAESDCAFALPLCSNSTVQTVGQYTDFGAVNDDQGTCFVSAFYGSASVWYSFYPQTNGPLDFSIAPTGGADYDFVLYDITNGCANKQQISCNYSEFSGATGLSDVHCSDAEIVQFGNCSNNSCSTDSKTDDCNRWNRRVNVLTTHHYALEITFYAGANYGFNLNFQNEAGSVAVTDNIPPTIANIGPSSCTSASTVHLDFSEYILCASIGNNLNEFSIPGYTVTVAATNCVSGHTLGIDLNIVPPLAPGTYNLTVTNITDICGNNLNQTVVINVSPPTAEAGPHAYVCASRTLPAFGTAYNYTYNPSPTTLTASGGSTYAWSNGGNTQVISVSPTTTTVYWVTASIGLCTATDSTIVYVEGANAGPDQTICSGQSIILTTGPAASYHWYSNPNVLFGTNGTSIGTTQSITVAPTVNTNYRVIVTTAHGCTSTWDLRVTISTGIVPTFAALGPYCVGQTPGTLPATSTNSISGTWNPPTISTAAAGTATYTFTPTAGSCATTATLSITITPGTVPTFTALGPYCVGDTPAILPATSTNGISGTWSPSSISTATSGSTVYTFTPTSGSCGNGSMTIVVNTATTPTFAAFGPFCIGASPTQLPTTSTNSITGIWSPATISTASAGTSVYTFTPTAGQCASISTMSITISSNITPTFTALGPYCVGATPTTLPITSNNSITGTWNPATISTTVAGTIVYTFTPTGSSCASTATMSVTVNTQTAPNFAVIPPLCSGTVAPLLDTTSPNGIVGTWSPAVISNTTSGTYTFTPNVGQCSSVQIVNVTVNPQTVSDFAAIPAFCEGTVAPILATTAPNGVIGTWSPATINNTTSGTYTFTPNSGSCPTNQILTVTVLAPTVPNFAAIPAFCKGGVAPILSNTSPNGITGIWNPSAIDNTTIGTYTFTPDAGQCASTTTLTSTIYPIPTVTATASPDAICSGTTSVLTGAGATTYSWMPGGLSGTSVNVAPTTTTIYTVLGTSAGNCTASNFVTVTLLSEAVLNFTSLPNEGCAPLTVQFNYNYDGTTDTTTLHWDFGDPSTTTDVSNETSPTYTYTNSGDFIVTLSGVSASGCTAFGQDIIHVLTPPIADFYADPAMTDMNLPLIHFYDESTNAYEWIWSFGDPHSNLSFEQFPEHTYDEPGSYPVTLVVQNGECVDTIIKYILVREAFTFYIPNTFTPTYDILNDNFNGKGMGYKTDEFELYIYDRWGEKIFYTNDPEKGWNGKMDGKDKVCMEGMYVYKFKVVELSGIEHKYIGIVLLLR